MSDPYRRWVLATFALVAAIVAQIGAMLMMEGRGIIDMVILAALLIVGYLHLDAKAPEQDEEQDIGTLH